MSDECNYAFKHRATGRVVITQTWPEFWEYQRKSNRGWGSDWIALDAHKRLGTTELTDPNPRAAWDACKRFNKFWVGAKGHEKCGELLCFGFMHIAVRLFLWHVHNIACMEGDQQLLNKVKADDKWFHSNGAHTRLLLTY